MLFQTTSSLSDTNITNKVFITCPLKPKMNMEGYLKEPMKLSLNSNWEQLMDINTATHFLAGLLPIPPSLQGILSGMVTTGLKASGSTFGKSGVFTTQCWLGASYVALGGAMRIVNWDNKAKRTANSFNEYISNLLVLASPVDKNDPDLKGNDGTLDEESAFLQLQPLTVTLTTPYFEFSNMVIQHAAVTYSKEMVGKEHLYADVAFDLLSKTVLNDEELATALNKTMPLR